MEKMFLLMYIKEYITRAKISMFTIALIFSLIFGSLGYLYSDRLTAIALSTIGGTLSILGINTTADIIGYGMPIGKSSGVFGTVIGVLIMLLF